ncbi:MAG: hypothetical protein PHV91_07135, partial [Bacteroidales bacterium]|nr:hypothetical protein [Bacteroidales bacterium]
MIKQFSIFFVLLSLVFPLESVARNNPKHGFLTLEECIARALESNYSVVISENTLEIAKNNVTLEPFLPVLSASSRLSDSRLDQRSYTSDGSRESAG